MTPVISGDVMASQDYISEVRYRRHRHYNADNAVFGAALGLFALGAAGALANGYDTYDEPEYYPGYYQAPYSYYGPQTYSYGQRYYRHNPHYSPVYQGQYGYHRYATGYRHMHRWR